MALSLYKYFQARESHHASYQELDFHMKALVDDVLNRLFADLSTPPSEAKKPATTGDPFENF